MIRIVSVGAVMLTAGCLVLAAASRAADPPGIPPETVADYLHSVIEADRTFYTIHVVERLQKSGGTKAAEDWRAKKDILLSPGPVSDRIERVGCDNRFQNPLSADQSLADQSQECA